MIEAERNVVLASAGSGKTYRLSGSYLRLVGMGVEPELILATTFTRKAAGEIAERVLRRAVEAARYEKMASMLDKQTRLTLGRSGWASCAVRLGRAIDRMRVQTLDSFFVTLAQEGASRLGLTPGWGMLSEHDEEALRLRAVDEALTRGGKDAMVALIRMLHGGDAESGVRRVIERVSLEGAGAYWATVGTPGAWEALPTPPGLLGESELHEQIERARSVALPTTKQGAPNKNWRNAVTAIVEGAEAGSPERVLSGTLVERLFEDDAAFSRIPVEEHHRAALCPLVRHAWALLVAGHHDKTRAAHRLLERTEHAMEGLKREEGLYAFDDVPRMLHALDDPERLRLFERLDARIDHLLLDEYQDTSLDQHALIAPIIEEIASDERAARAFVCVGDVKQALYLWRDASPEILSGLGEGWATITRETLTKSWRTAQQVLDAVNDVFDDLETSPAFDEATVGGARLFGQHWTAQESAHLEMPGHVTLGEVDASADEEGGDARFEAAAQHAKMLCERYPHATIGVLTRTKKGVIPRLLWRLREHGVDASEEGGNPLTDSPAVVAAMSALRFSAHPGDTMASFHAGSSALAGELGIPDPLDDDTNERASSRVRRLLVELGPARLFERWHRSCRDRMTARDVARFGQLVELAARLEREGGDVDPMSIIERVRTERVEAPTRARVRVMTIHAAKGLEFDAVILPDLERRWSISKDRFLVDRPDPFGPVRAVTRYPNAALRDASPELAEVHGRALERHVLGELCGLYVAMTRARYALHAIIDEPKDAGVFGGRCSDVLRAALAPVSGDPRALLKTDLERAEPAPLERIELKLSRRAELGSGALARRAPSSVAREAHDVPASSLLRLDRRAADAGMLIHAACELIGWADEEDFDRAEAVHLLVEREGATESEASGAVERVVSALEREGVRSALSRGRYEVYEPHDRVELWRERAFAARVDMDGEGAVLLSGRFDRVVVGYAGERVAWCEVVDFKSEAAVTGSAEEAAGGYRAQMEAYRAALVAMTGVHPDAVRTMLVFVDRGEAVVLERSV